MNRAFDKKGRKSTLAFFIPSLQCGGAERQVIALGKGIDKARWRVLIITFRPHDANAAGRTDIDNVKIINVPREDANIFNFLTRLKRILISENVLILHAYLITAQLYALLIKLLGWKGFLIFGVRDSLPLFYHKTLKDVLCDLIVFNPYYLADRYIFNSHAGITAKSQAIPSARKMVIFNSVDIARFQPSPESRLFLRRMLGVEKDAFVVGIIANASQYKDYPTFVQSAKLVMQKMGSVYFVAIGNCESEEGQQAKALVNDLLMGGRFHFLGSRADVESLIPGLDVFCSSSITEGFSNVICEAMASGVPCVVTNVGDSAFIVENAGKIVPPRDPQLLADAILFFLNIGEEERRRLGALGRMMMAEKFSLEKMVSQHEAIYEDLCQSRS